jgi:uncharacterized membrane protein
MGSVREGAEMGSAKRAGGKDLPPGWSYNPSAWKERWPLICLAAVGFVAAVYTGFSQLGIFPSMWDPFFGSASSYAVTHSALSRLLPFPDGVLGILGYIGDLVFGSIGGDDRWRRMPWVVLLFGITITVLGFVSLLLTIMQGAVVHSWCTVCLVSATVSTLIFGLGIGEALAALQYLSRLRLERGWGAAWRALWGRLERHKPAAERPTSGMVAAG